MTDESPTQEVTVKFRPSTYQALLALAERDGIDVAQAIRECVHSELAREIPAYKEALLNHRPYQPEVSEAQMKHFQNFVRLNLRPDPEPED